MRTHACKTPGVRTSPTLVQAQLYTITTFLHSTNYTEKRSVGVALWERQICSRQAESTSAPNELDTDQRSWLALARGQFRLVDERAVFFVFLFWCCEDSQGQTGAFRVDAFFREATPLCSFCTPVLWSFRHVRDRWLRRTLEKCIQLPLTEFPLRSVSSAPSNDPFC